MAVWCKVLGGLLVFGSCTLCGFWLAWQDAYRADELAALRKAFVLLKGEIQYALAPLPEAFADIAARTKAQAARFFLDMAAHLALRNGDSAADVWAAASHSLQKASHLSEEDMQCLHLLGQSFGYLDGATQAQGLDLAIAYIDETTASLQKKSAANGRMYRSVGMLCGALIAIALL